MSLEEAIQKIASRKSPDNEETAKLRVILPILEALGWDVHDDEGTGEVEFERSVGPGRGSKKVGRVDIALMRSNRVKQECVCLIEAKAPRQKLEDHVDQLVNYAFHEGVDLCVLTNSSEWWLFLPREKGPIHERRFAELKLSDDPAQVADSFQQFLGKENVLNGEANTRAKARLKARQDVEYVNTALPRVWEQMQTELDPGLVELVTRKFTEESGLRPSRQQVEAILQGKSISLPSQVQDSVSGSESEDQNKNQEKIRTRSQLKLSAVTLWEEEYRLTYFSDALVKVCELLYFRHPHNFSDADGIRVGNRVYVSSLDTRLRERTRKKIPNSRFWVDTDLMQKDILALISRLLDCFSEPASALSFTLRGDTHRLSLQQIAELLPKGIRSIENKTSASAQERKKVNRPEYFVLWNKRHDLRRKTHYHVLKGVCEELFARHPDAYERISKSNFNMGTIAIVPSSSIPGGGGRIPGTQYSLHTHLSSKNMKKQTLKLLKLFGYSASDLHVPEWEEL